MAYTIKEYPQNAGVDFRQVTVSGIEGKSPYIGAENNVDFYQNELAQLANYAIDDLIDSLNSLGTIDFSGLGFAANAGALPDFGINFTTTAVNPEYNSIYATDTDTAITQPTVGNIDTGDIEAQRPDPFTGEAPPINAPIKPSPLDPNDKPGDAPSVGNYPMPDAPDDPIIPDPLLKDVPIPSQININIEDFTATAPDISWLSRPSTDFAFTDSDYDSALLALLKTKITEFVNGGVTIPDYIWDMIWDKARNREEAMGNKLITEIKEEWAARGFNMPTGTEVARIDEVHMKVFDAVSTLTREQVIERAKFEIENLKYGVAQGLALEQMLGGWHQQKMERALKAAIATVEMALAIYNAEIAMVNLQVQVYQAHLEVWKAKLQAELTKIEQLKADIERSRMIGEINKIELQIFQTRWDAYKTEVQAYVAQLDAVKTQISVDVAKIDAYGKEVQAYGELVRAKTAEYSAYKAQWDGETAKMNMFESEVRAYAAEVGAYKTSVDAEVSVKSLEFQNNEQSLKKYATQIEQFNAKVRARAQEMAEKQTKFEAEYKEWQSQFDEDKTRVGTTMENLKTKIMYADQITRAAIATADNKTKASIGEKDQIKASQEIMARAYGQLAASALSAISVSASIGDSASNQFSNSISTSASGGDV